MKIERTTSITITIFISCETVKLNLLNIFKTNCISSIVATKSYPIKNENGILKIFETPLLSIML